MKTIAYSYSDPLLDSVPDVSSWGVDVEQIYQDFGERQQLEQLLKDCREHPPESLIVQRLEDLGDSLQEVGDRLLELESLGIHLITLAEAIAPDRNIVPRADVLKLFQTLQDNQRRRRIQQGHARNRIKALPPPGKAPYGYRRGKDRYIVDRTTAPIVKDFVEHFILYGSLRGSVRYLQKKYNKKIAVSTGKRWLTSPVYRGDLVYQTGEVVPETHPPIISRQEAAQVNRLLRRNRQLAPRSASAPRSLAGLAVCATCQSPMTVSRVTARRSDQEYLYLRPIACPNQPKCRAIAYSQILEQTIERICEDLPRAVASTPMPDMDRLKQGLSAQISQKQAVLEQLPGLIASGVLDAETAELRAYKVRTEIAALQNRLAQLPPVSLQAIAQAVSIPQFWLDLSEAERRFYFREFIRQIQIIRDDKTWRLQLVFVF
jgi:DNA invertase Pin-like site-specific DNA recombinase